MILYKYKIPPTPNIQLEKKLRVNVIKWLLSFQQKKSET